MRSHSSHLSETIIGGADIGETFESMRRRANVRKIGQTSPDATRSRRARERSVELRKARRNARKGTASS
jgi:hypothetical protein